MAYFDHKFDFTLFLIDEYSRKHVNLGNCKKKYEFIGLNF